MTHVNVMELGTRTMLAITEIDGVSFDRIEIPRQKDELLDIIDMIKAECEDQCYMVESDGQRWIECRMPYYKVIKLLYVARAMFSHPEYELHIRM